MSGYTPCACRDCMQTAIGTQGLAMCSECEESGCEPDSECQAPHAYCAAESHTESSPDVCPACGQQW